MADDRLDTQYQSRQIPLYHFKKLRTDGKFAIVDGDDYDFLMQWKWHLAICKGAPYIARLYYNNDKYMRMYMHRALMSPPKGMEVDHINGNPLDNRRCNLRICYTAQNQANRKKTKANSSSKYKGVSWHKRNNRWMANIKLNGNLFHLGGYKIEADAAKAYDEAAKELFGEFARPNFTLGNCHEQR